MSKGSQIYLEGKLQTRNYEKDGQTHYTTEIITSNFQFLDGRQNNAQGGSAPYQGNAGFNKSVSPDNFQGQTSPGMTEGQPEPDDDIPF